MMRKYRYGSSSYSSKPNNWLRSLLLVILLGLPLGLLALELGLKNFAPAQWLGNKANDTTLNYELKLITGNGKTLLSDLPTGDLQVKTSPVSGYELVSNQATKFWQINAQGFRLDKPVSINKEREDIRVFVVGNSTAFGSMAANNQTIIAPKLEQLLNNRLRAQTAQPRKFQPVIFPYFADQVEKVRLLPPRIRSGNYQVITAAVPGYTSTNELSLLVHKISEFKPDCLIFLNGYEDLRSPSNRPTRELINLEDVIQQLEQRERSNNEQKFQGWLNSFYLVKAFQRLSTPSNSPTTSGYYQIFNANQLSDDPSELNLRVANYDSSLRKISNLNSKIPIIIALQPEITGKSTLTPDESKVVKALGQDYSDRITKSYKALESKVLGRNLNNTKVISLYNAFNDTKEQVFIDPIHLTDAGNTLLAKQLFNALEDTFKLQPQPAPEPS